MKMNLMLPTLSRNDTTPEKIPAEDVFRNESTRNNISHSIYKNQEGKETLSREIEMYDGKDSVNMETVKKLYNMGERSHSRKKFLDEYFEFMKSRGRPVTKVPVVAKLPLDLYRLYTVVQNFGGFSQVVKKRRWSQVVRALELPTSITSAAFTLRTQYLRLLYHFECEKKGLSPVLASYEHSYYEQEELYKNCYDRSLYSCRNTTLKREHNIDDVMPLKRPRTAENIVTQARSCYKIERSRSSDDAILTSMKETNVESIPFHHQASHIGDNKLIDLTAANRENERIKDYFREVDLKENAMKNYHTSPTYDNVRKACTCWDCVKQCYYDFNYPPNLKEFKYHEQKYNGDILKRPPYVLPSLAHEERCYNKIPGCECLSHQRHVPPVKSNSGMDVNIVNQSETALVLTVVFNGIKYDGTLLSNMKRR